MDGQTIRLTGGQILLWIELSMSLIIKMHQFFFLFTDGRPHGPMNGQTEEENQL